MSRILLIPIFTFGLLSHSETPPGVRAFPRMLSYQKLIALTPARRMAYIDHIRLMMLDLSRMENGTLVTDSNDDLSNRFVAKNGFILFWLSLSHFLLPEAQATSCENPNYPFAVGPLCGALCSYRDVTFGEVGRAVGNSYFCFPRADYNSLTQTQRSSLSLSPETAAEVSAPSGESHLRQEALRNTQSRKAQAVREKLEARQQAIAEIQRKKAMGEDLADEQERVAKKSRKEIQREDDMTDEQERVAKKSRKEIEQEDLADEQEAAAKERRKEISAEDEDDAKKAEAEKVERKKAEDIRKGVIGKGGGVCTTPTLSCAGTAKAAYRKMGRKDALKKFRSAAPKTCISSGNMSKYTNGEVKPKNCSVVHDFCLSKDDCSKAARTMENGFLSKYSCGRQAICPPMVYGLESKTKAVCVPSKGQHLTEACDKKAKGLEHKSSYIKDYLGQAPGGVSEAWNEYADAFNDTCKQNSASIDAHCEECGIIGTRLKEGHLLASGTCDDALDYQQFHGTSKSDR